MSYLQACDDAAGDESARQVRIAVELAIAGELSAPVTIQIPCDSPGEPRWFDVLVSSRFDDARRASGRRSPCRAAPPAGVPPRPPASISFPINRAWRWNASSPSWPIGCARSVDAQARMRLLIEATSTPSAEPKLSTVMTQLTVLARELVGATHATVNRIGAGPLTPARTNWPCRSGFAATCSERCA